MRVLRVGDRVEPGVYRLHSRFRHAANYLCGDHLVSLVDDTLPPGPLEIVIEGSLPIAEEIAVEPGIIRLGTTPCPAPPSLRYDSALPPGPPGPDRVEELATHLCGMAHPKSLAFLLDAPRLEDFRTPFEQAFALRMQDGIRQLFDSDPIAGVHAIKGGGIGLTPSGDDFLAGVLIGRRLGRTGASAGEITPGELYLAARGANPLSNAFLALARDGRVNEPIKQLVLALRPDREQNIASPAQAVLSMGETSGADLLTGLVMMLRQSARTGSAERGGPRPHKPRGR